MTLIIAANLSDRIYMSADTRLSLKKKDGSVNPLHDNQLKIEPISNNIIIGSAGVASMGSFIIKALRNHKLSSVGIREFREKIDFELRAIVGEYLSSTSPSPSYHESNVALIFAGFDSTKRRTIKADQLFKLVREYQDLKQNKTNNMFGGKDLKNLTQAELIQLREHMMNSQQGIKHIILSALKQGTNKNGLIELPISDHHVFAVEIRCGADDVDKFRYIDCEWGNYIARGSDITEENIPRDFFGELDFKMSSGDPYKDSVPLIYWIQKNYSASIGGAITNFIIMEDQILQTSGEVIYRHRDNPEFTVLYGTFVIDGHFYRKSKRGFFYRLCSLSEYSNEGDCLL